MKSFKRHGRGILLHDNGLSGIINSSNNSLRGHNVLFGQNSIISINYIGQDCEIVYKYGRSMLQINLKRKYNEMMLEGVGCLIEFDLKRIYKLIYQSGDFQQKILQDHDFSNKFFTTNDLSLLIS